MCNGVPLPAYDDSIASDATNAVRAKAERLWTTKIGLQTPIKTVGRAGRAFLIAVVEDTWLLPLKEDTTFYNKVPHRDFFARLKGGRGAAKNVAPLSGGLLLTLERELMGAESGFSSRPDLASAWEAIPVGALFGKAAGGEEGAGGYGRQPLVIDGERCPDRARGRLL